MSEESPDRARSAGRGGLAVLFAKVFFIGTGLVQQALLPRAIGLADYGALSRVFAVANVFNNVIVASSTQGVSRTVAAAGASEREALRATLRVHAPLAIFAGVLLAGAAPLFAYFQRAPEILAPLFVMTGVLAIYGVYAPLVGYLNGRGSFTRQASLDVIAATLRTALLLGLGWAGVKYGGHLALAIGTSPGVLGAATGAVLAALGVFLVALRWTGTGAPLRGERAAGIPDVRAYLGLVVPVMVAQLFTNGVMQADIIMLGRYLSLAASATDGAVVTAAPGDALGVTAAATAAAAAANEWVGVYRACQLFAFLPYQLLFSVTQILFPMLARARAEEGETRVAELVSRGSRIGAVVCGMLVCVVLAMPESLVKFAYGAEVAARGAQTLRLLAIGQAAFAMLGLAATILVSLGRERAAMALTAVALLLMVIACTVLIPRAEFGAAQLTATATATTIAMVVTLTLAIVAVKRTARAFVPLTTALRVGACVAAAFFVGGVMPVFPKLLTPLVAAGVAVAYGAALVATGELGKTDLALLRSIATRRKKA